MTTAMLSTFSITGGLAAEFIARGEMIPWSGTLVVEGGTGTGDRRKIEMGALTHRVLPLPFMVQLENPVNGDGHDGATLTGRIDTLQRLDNGAWWAEGFIDPTMADGTTLALAIDKQLMRGISVDLDQVAGVEVQGPDGPSYVITSARIIGGTATPFQAFAEAEISLDVDKMSTALAASADFPEWEAEMDGHLAQVWSPIDAIETLVASGAMGHTSIPVDPPGAWFARRDFTELTPLTILANGQVFGHIAAWGTCHISFANRCQPVPRSKTNYAKFRNASVLTAEGTQIRTGPIVMDTVHPDLRWKASDAQTFYANSGSAIADVVPYEDQFGIVVVGAMRPTATPAQMRAFRGSDISPDWRTIDGHKHECCALLAVNNSGFKLPQTLVASAGVYVEAGDTAIAIDPYDEVYALVASGPMRSEPCCDDCAEHHDAIVASAPTDQPTTEEPTMDNPERDARLAAVRARFAPIQPKVRSTFTLAAAEFTSEGARKAAITRARLHPRSDTEQTPATIKREDGPDARPKQTPATIKREDGADVRAKQQDSKYDDSGNEHVGSNVQDDRNAHADNMPKTKHHDTHPSTKHGTHTGAKHSGPAARRNFKVAGTS